MELVSVECPSCGASLPPAMPTGEYRCAYCGAGFHLAGARGAKTVAGVRIDMKELLAEMAQQHQQSIAAAEAHQQARKIGRLATIWVAIAVFVAVGTTAASMFMRVRATGGAGSGGFPGIGAVQQALEDVQSRLLWDSVGGLPAPVLIAGKPAVIGRTRDVLGGDLLFVDTYDAGSGERLWRVDQLGTYSSAYQHVLYAVAGDAVVISDGTAKVHVHDLVSGVRRSTVSLTDQVEMLCVPAGSQGAGVWVEQIDERSHLLDLATATLTAASRPKTCAESKHEAVELASGGPVRFSRNHQPRKPKLDGIEVKRSWIDGGIAVALAVKQPGTPVPRAIGFDPKSGAARWDQVIPSVDINTVRREEPFGAYAAGRVFASYGEGTDAWHLTAFDAHAGARLWDVTLRSIFAVDSLGGLLATDTHAFLVRSSSLEIYDAATGKLTATIGKETYD